MTPWQKVFAKFELSQNALARGLGRHRSKISLAVRDERGLISGNDQADIIRLAKERGVKIDAADLTPDIK